MRWYNLPSSSKDKSSAQPENEPETYYGSNGLTRCSSFVNPLSLLRRNTADKSTAVGLLRVLLQTLKYYCQVCKACILKDKSPKALISEYIKRVLMIILN